MLMDLKNAFNMDSVCLSIYLSIDLSINTTILLYLTSQIFDCLGRQSDEGVVLEDVSVEDQACNWHKRASNI